MATKAARGGSAAPAGTEDAPTTQQGVSSPAPLGEREQRERDATRMMVGVRVRPLSKSERAKGSHSCLTVAEGTQVFAKDPDDKMGGRDYLRLQHNKDQAYQFDHAFSDESGSAEVYEKLVQRVVRAVMAGYNGACFAYGATGSGKTFTMLGEAGAPGVMPAAVAEVMAAARNDDECEYSFGVTYVEIYNEKVKDLLNPHAAADLEVREDARQGTHIQGAVERKVSSEVEIMEYMQAGSMYRTTEATNCNEVSSRSHAVLQLSVKAIHRFGEGGGKKKRQSKLSLIDLAGSERAYKTDNRGQRLVEGRNINRSLLSLANCINALADKTRKSAHVPYRDSKLTRLLKDSLSGSSVATMICNVSPSSDQYEETLNTLKYANRAKQMTPPQMPEKQEQPYNAVQEQVKVLTELQGTLVQMAKAMGKAAPGRDGSAPARPAARAVPSKRAASIGGAYGAPPAKLPPVHRASTGSSNGAGMLGAGVGEVEEVEASMAGVRRALDELVSRQPDAHANAEVHAAYVSLDNMEGEELSAISEESAVLWREQQAILTELSSAQHHLKVSKVSLAWREASTVNEPGADSEADNLRAVIEKETANVARLRADLHKTRDSIAQLQADIPQRVVSSQRLSMLRLAMKQQEAATESLRFKMQARNKVAIMQEVMRVWHPAIPPQLRSLLLTLFDLQLVPTGAALAQPLPGSPSGIIHNGQAAGGGSPTGIIQGGQAANNGGGSAPRDTFAAPDGDDADDGSQAGGEDEEAEDRELNGGAFVLGADGTASPWRTLGALAIRAALGGGDGGRAAVWEEARRGLQGARMSRPGVLSYVQESSASVYPDGGDMLPTDDDAWNSAPPLASLADRAPIAVKVRPTADACADPLMMSYHPDVPQWLKKPDFAPADIGLPARSPPTEQPHGAPETHDLMAKAHVGGSDALPPSQRRADFAPAEEPLLPPQTEPAPPTPVRAGASSSRQPPPPPSPHKKQPPLPPHWHEATDSAGQIYYYNDRTNLTSWERPANQNYLGSVSAAAAPGRPSSARQGRPAAAARSGVAEGGRPASAGPKPPAARGVKSAGPKRDPPFR